MQPSSIVEGFIQSAKRYPSKVAIRWKSEAISYEKVLDNVCRKAGFLLIYGIKKGDRVAFYGEKSPHFVYTYLATHLVQAVCVPIDVKLPEERLKEVLKQTEPGILLHPANIEYPFTQFPFNNGLLECDPIKEFELPNENDLADILFTTGTTGSSKGVMLTHKNILAGVLNSNAFIGNDATDTEIIPLPLHHAFGLRRLRTNMFLGGTVILVDGFLYPKLFFSAIEELGASGICMVPAGFSIIKRLMKDRYIEYFRKLKYIEFGSSPMNLEEKKELLEQLQNTKICMHYGLTEVAANVFLEFHRDKEKLQALGLPGPNVKLSILGSDGEEMNTGEIGEIGVQGDIQTSGYWNNPDLTDRSFINGWFRTGDLGFVDKEGYVFFSGRKDDVINVGGKKVFPAEIEEVLGAHPDIKDSACVSKSIEGNLTGEQIVGFVVLETGKSINAKELTLFLRTRVEPHKIPGEFRFVKSIPYTLWGKKQREKFK